MLHTMVANVMLTRGHMPSGRRVSVACTPVVKTRQHSSCSKSFETTGVSDLSTSHLTECFDAI